MDEADNTISKARQIIKWQLEDTLHPQIAAAAYEAACEYLALDTMYSYYLSAVGWHALIPIQRDAENRVEYFYERQYELLNEDRDAD